MLLWLVRGVQWPRRHEQLVYKLSFPQGKMQAQNLCLESVHKGTGKSLCCSLRGVEDLQWEVQEHMGVSQYCLSSALFDPRPLCHAFTR